MPLTLAQREQVNVCIELFTLYRTAYAESAYAGDVGLVNPIFLTKGDAGLLLLAEVHDDPTGDVHGAAKLLAQTILNIPNVIIAVEEPDHDNPTFPSKAAVPTTARLPVQTVFGWSANLAASLAHQIYVEQFERGIGADVPRFPAEPLINAPLGRFMPAINLSMANLLNQGAVDHSVTVYPVGLYHLIDNPLGPVLPSVQRILRRDYGWV